MTCFCIIILYSLMNVEYYVCTYMHDLTCSADIKLINNQCNHVRSTESDFNSQFNYYADQQYY